MVTDVIRLPEEDYNKVVNSEKTLLFCSPEYRLNILVDDWVVIVFNGLPYNNVLVEVEDIGSKRFSNLTDNDALDSGYDSLSDLKKALVGRYVTLDNASLLYFYRFSLMGTSEKVG